jgi:secreted protein with Ig-like and vWFA domain
MQVSMITYSGNHYRREVYPWNFAKNNEEFKKSVRDIRAIGGTTNTYEAMKLALKLMETRNKTIPT